MIYRANYIELIIESYILFWFSGGTAYFSKHSSVTVHGGQVR